MAYRILGQSFPSAGVAEILYSVPTGKQCVISSFKVCNQSTDPDATFKLARVLSGESLSTSGGKQWIFWNEPLRYSYGEVEGLTLGAGDSLYVVSSNSALSFNLSGLEVST